jgi:hypothetical protein
MEKSSKASLSPYDPKTTSKMGDVDKEKAAVTLPKDVIRMKNGVDILINPNSGKTGYDPTTGPSGYVPMGGKGGIVSHYEPETQGLMTFNEFVSLQNKYTENS